MEEMNAGTILYEWLCCKKNAPEDTIQDFLLRKYLEIHNEDGQNIQQKTKDFQKRMDTWEEVSQQFGSYAGAYRNYTELESWQGAQMLENVILELEMDETERYRYLLNVEMMIGAEICRLLEESAGEGLKSLLEHKYEEAWDKAQDGVTEAEFQKRFSETVSLMQYAGIAYDDENRRILAEIGAGWQTGFERLRAGDAERDICFLMDFLVSEMIASEDGMYTKEEQELITDQAVPVCVSSVSMIRAGSDPHHMKKMAYSYLGKIFTEKNTRIFFCVAAVFAAVKALFLLAELVIAGTVLKIGVSALWDKCRGYLDADLPEGFFNRYLEKITGKKYTDTDWEDSWEEELEEFADEEEYEHD